MAVQLVNLCWKCQTDGSIIEPGFRYKKSGFAQPYCCTNCNHNFI